MELSDNQSQAVCHLEGPLMVLAGPGSGKTTVITHRALRLAREIDPSQVLVITFSRAAANEMEIRFKALAGSKMLSPANCCTFGTFHATFFRVLRKRYGYNLDQVLQEGERREIINKLLASIGFEADEDMSMAIRNEISLVKNELYDLQYYNSAAMGTDEFRQLFEIYEEVKNEQNKIDFDDMLTLCYRLWQQEPDCLAFWQKKFQYIMVDEFQDINHVQYECMRMLSSAPHHLCVVGDDDQCIYRFRGARPEFLLRFPEDYPNVKHVILDTNYRSTNPIIAFSNKLIAQNQVRYDKSIVGTEKAGPSPKVVVCKDQNQEAEYAARKIKKHPNFNDVAIIYRTNMQARAFVDAFMQANIPFTVKDEASVIYEHWVAQDIFAYLRLGCGLGTVRDVERVINKPFRFISKAFLQKARQTKRDIFEWYTESGMLNAAQQQRIEELMLQIRSVGKLPTADAVKYIRKKIGYDDHIKDYCEFRKVNSAGLYEIAAELQESAEAFTDISSYLNHAEDAIQNKNTKDPEGERVTLTTMHSAKGLEFDTVYIVGAVEGLIPHERSRTAAELEEERRLFYVGATRAKRHLYILVIKKRHEKDVEPSRFIKELKKARKLPFSAVIKKVKES